MFIFFKYRLQESSYQKILTNTNKHAKQLAGQNSIKKLALLN